MYREPTHLQTENGWVGGRFGKLQWILLVFCIVDPPIYRRGMGGYMRSGTGQSVTVRIVPSPDMYRGPTHLQTGNGWVGGTFSMDFACFLYRGPTHLQTGNGWVHAIRTGADPVTKIFVTASSTSDTHPFTDGEWVGRWNVFDGFCLFFVSWTHPFTGGEWVGR